MRLLIKPQNTSLVSILSFDTVFKSQTYFEANNIDVVRFCIIPDVIVFAVEEDEIKVYFTGSLRE